MFLPFAPPTIPIGALEWGWTEALADAWIRNRIFGRDIIFTYGPYGFVEGYYLHPGVLFERLGVRAAMTALFVTLMWRIGRLLEIPRWQSSIAILLGLHALFHPDIWVVQANAIVWLGVLHAWARSATHSGPQHAGRTHRVDVFLMLAWATMLPLLMWVKFTVFVLGFPAMLGAGLIASRRNRKVAASGVAVFLAALPIWWMMAGQPLGAMFDYLWWSVDLSLGYSDSMVRPASTQAFLAAVSGIAILFGATSAVLASADRLSKVVVQWLTAFILAIVYRSSIIRHSGLGLGLLLSMMCPFLLLVCWHRSGQSSRASRACRIAIACAGVIGVVAWNIPCEEIVGYNAFSYFTAPFAQVPHRLSLIAKGTGLRQIAEADFRARRPDVASLLHLPHPQTFSADLLNNNIHLVIGQSFKYQPRPIFQSYNVWTEREARLNANFFEGPDAPDLVFYDSSLIDFRYPTLDDHACWPTLISRYAPVATVTDDCLVAARRPVSLIQVKGRESQAVRRFDEWIELAPLLKQNKESSGPIWCSIDYKPSAIGALYGLGLQPIFAGIEVRMATGEIHQFRLVRSSASAGFILSPTLFNRNAALSFWHDPMAPPIPSRRVVAIRVCAWHEADWAFDPNITLRVSRLGFSAK